MTVTLSKYRWVLVQAGLSTRLSLQPYSGPDVLDVATKPIGYRVRKLWDCRCESRMYAEPAENFPAGVPKCQVCLSPVAVAGCCENCFTITIPDISVGGSVIFHRTSVGLWKTGVTACSARGSAIDKTRFIGGNPPFPTLQLLLDELSTSNQLVITLLDGDTSYTAHYKLAKQLSCSTKLLTLVSQTQTTGGTTTAGTADWPASISIAGSTCGFVPDGDDGGCECDTMCVDFAGMDNHAVVGGMDICHYTQDPVGTGTVLPFGTAGTKVKQNLFGCAPSWSGGPIPGGTEMDLHQIGESSAFLHLNTSFGSFTYSCGEFEAWYTCDAFACSKGGLFTFARATNWTLHGGDGTTTIYGADDTVSTWPATIRVYPKDEC